MRYFTQLIKKLNAYYSMSGWYEAKCPFHEDEGNSMIFTEEGFECVGCGTTGTLKKLATKAGIEVQEGCQVGVDALISQIAELTAERDRYRERCEELESRLDLGTGNMYDVVCAENEKLREVVARSDDGDGEEDVIFSSDVFRANGTGEYFTDEDYARIYRDINEQVEAVRPLMEVFREDDAALKKLLDDFQVTITITPKTLPDNEEDDCEPDD